MLDQYLKDSVIKLKSNNYEDLNIVLGNESCDLDSAVCTLVYATYLNWQHNQIKCKVCTKNDRDKDTGKDDIFVPILNVNRKDYPLKTEVKFCLEECNIEDCHLVFRDDLDLPNIVKTTKTNATLVDHHVLSKRDEFLAPYVTEIIDHRPIDKTGWHYKADTRSTIEIVGSCSTLVVQRIKDLEKLLAKEIDFFKVYPICAKLLYSAVILDTVNFSKEVNKATPHDENIVLFLETILKTEDYETERKQVLERLLHARSDVSALSPGQILRKDTKIVGHVYVPSFPILVEEYLELDEALPAVAVALADSGCSVALLLGMSLKGKLRRDVAIYCPDQAEADKLAAFLQQWKKPSLQLSFKDGVTKAPGCNYFTQMNLSASRKQFIPAIQEYLKSK